MAQLKEIRSRIASINNTRQVTSAMKMVSAAKLKKAQDAIIQITPYDKKLQEVLRNLSAGDVDFNSVYFNEPELNDVLIVVVGANRGLCGGFNANAGKVAMQYVNENIPELLKSNNVKFLPIGRQVEKSLKSNGVNFHGEGHDLLNDHNYTEIAKVASELMKLFAEGKYQRIVLAYNKFKNAAVQELTCEQFLPVVKPSEDEKSTSTDYIFEPSQGNILSSLIPQTLKMHLYRVLLDSNAAENGARMTAMHQATDNATDLLKDLKTTYNNARQASITNEILEITAGAEALKG